MSLKDFFRFYIKAGGSAVESLELISLGFSVSQKLLDVWDLDALTSWSFFIGFPSFSELLDWDTNVPSIDSQNGAFTSVFQPLFHFYFKGIKVSDK